MKRFLAIDRVLPATAVLIAASAQASGGLHLLDFGITERFSFQSHQEGANLSTMPSWNPGYRLSNGIDLRAYLGLTGMRSNHGNLVAIQPQVGAAYRPETWCLFPEVLVGAQTWAISEGGTHAAISANLHYAFHFGESAPVLLRALDTVTIGYTAVPVPSRLVSQATLGLRFAIWPASAGSSPSSGRFEEEKRQPVQAPTNPSKSKPEPAITPEPEPAPTAPTPVPAPKPVTKNLDKIDFEPNHTQVSSEATKELDEVVALMKKHPDIKLEIRGYTDTTGPLALNMRISKDRAESVKKYVLDHGIDPSQLVAQGFGPQNPIEDNATAEGRAANRRVELQLVH